MLTTAAEKIGLEKSAKHIFDIKFSDSFANSILL